MYEFMRESELPDGILLFRDIDIHDAHQPPVSLEPVTCFVVTPLVLFVSFFFRVPPTCG